MSTARWFAREMKSRKELFAKYQTMYSTYFTLHVSDVLFNVYLIKFVMTATV